MLTLERTDYDRSAAAGEVQCLVVRSMLRWSRMLLMTTPAGASVLSSSPDDFSCAVWIKANG